VALADAAQRLIYVNESFLKMWGYETSEEIIGQNVREFWQFPEEASAVVKKILLTEG
jgi:PAS domain S-box-containing protein